MARTGSPDESLIGDDSLLPADKGGLSYPLGDQVPAMGEAIPLGSGVRWARLPLSGPGGLNHINIWLIDDRDEQGDGVAVVDTGMFTPDGRAAWEALLTGPLAGLRLTRVIVTHFHPDHIGMAGWLCERFGIRLWMTREEWLTASLMRADMRDEPPREVTESWHFAGWSEDQIAQAAALGWRRIAKMVSPVPAGHIRLIEGDMLNLAGEQWRVMIGRGHAPEHACLFNERSGLFIAGDQILPAISSNVSVHAAEPLANPLKDWLDSIDRFLGLPADLLILPAHGQPFMGVDVRLAALRDRHHEQLDMLHAHLREPRRVVDCFAVLFRREINGFFLFPATGETLAHLRWLECEGRVVRRTDAEGVGWFSAVH